MTSVVYLVRHGAHDALGRELLPASAPLGLNAIGNAQAARLAIHFRRVRPALVAASPSPRTLATAAPIADAADAPLREVPQLSEVDFGAWAGVRFDRLATDSAWRRWNERRGSARAPGGETMAEAQARALAGMGEALAHIGEGESAVLVSHGDIIRALAAAALRLPLDDVLRFDVDPASITVLAVAGETLRLLTLNDRSCA